MTFTNGAVTDIEDTRDLDTTGTTSAANGSPGKTPTYGRHTTAEARGWIEMHHWILIKASEDGNPVSYLTTHELEQLLQDPGSYGVEKFLSQIPAETDPNYWVRGEALLFYGELIAPPIPQETL